MDYLSYYTLDIQQNEKYIEIELGSSDSYAGILCICMVFLKRRKLITFFPSSWELEGWPLGIQLPRLSFKSKNRSQTRLDRSQFAFKRSHSDRFWLRSISDWSNSLSVNGSSVLKLHKFSCNQSRLSTPTEAPSSPYSLYNNIHNH